MNIFSDEDLKNYFKKGQMYIRKEVVDHNFKTIFNGNTVYNIEGITVEWINEQTVICEIFFNDNGIKSCNFFRTCTKGCLYAELKTSFIHVSEMYESWKKDLYH